MEPVVIFIVITLASFLGFAWIQIYQNREFARQIQMLERSARTHAACLLKQVEVNQYFEAKFEGRRDAVEVEETERANA